MEKRLKNVPFYALFATNSMLFWKFIAPKRFLRTSVVYASIMANMEKEKDNKTFAIDLFARSHNGNLYQNTPPCTAPRCTLHIQVGSTTSWKRSWESVTALHCNRSPERIAKWAERSPVCAASPPPRWLVDNTSLSAPSPHSKLPI